MNQWIKVSDRLPKQDECVLVVCIDYETGVYYPSCIGYFVYNDDGEFMVHKQIIGDIVQGIPTYWMSIPSLPPESL